MIQIGADAIFGVVAWATARPQPGPQPPGAFTLFLHPWIPVVYMIEIPHRYDEETKARRGGENPHGSASAASMTYLGTQGGAKRYVPFRISVLHSADGEAGLGRQPHLSDGRLTLPLRVFRLALFGPHAHSAHMVCLPLPSRLISHRSPIKARRCRLSLVVVGLPSNPTSGLSFAASVHRSFPSSSEEGRIIHLFLGVADPQKVPKGCLVPS